jgi:hypothetical protein
MAIEWRCARLVNEYANRLDAYDYPGFLALFSDDAVLNMLGREFAGKPAIAGWLEGREADMVCRHLVTNVTTDVVDENHAAGFNYTVSYRARGWRGREPALFEPPTFLVEYRSRFVFDSSGQWRFSRRDVFAVLVGEEQMRLFRPDPNGKF